MVNTPGGGASRNVRRPDLMAGVNPYLVGADRLTVNPAAFATPAPGTFGNVPRNFPEWPEISNRSTSRVVNKESQVYRASTNLEFAHRDCQHLQSRVNFDVPGTRV